MAFLHFLLHTRLIIKIIFDFYLDTYLLMCYKIHKFHFSKFFTYTSLTDICVEKHQVPQLLNLIKENSMRFGEKSDLASRTKVLREEVYRLWGFAQLPFLWNFLDYFPLFELSLPLTPPFEFFIVVKNWVNPPHRLILF